MSRPRRVSRTWALLSLAALVWTPRAAAMPQASLGATVGGAVENAVPGPAGGAFSLGGRSDVLFGRSRGTDMAFGPYVEAGTLSFHNLDAAAGAEWLIPLRDELPLVVSVGALVRDGGGRSWASGVESSVFFGSRSYNFHSWYGMATGLFVQTRWIPGPQATVDAIFGVQIDAELLVMPALLLVGLFKQD